MRSASRMPVWLSIVAVATAAGLVGFAGCSLVKPEGTPQQGVPRIGGHGGQLIEPKRCYIRVAIVDRPFRDPAINDALWKVVDEQSIAPEVRKGLSANGLRVGRVIGDLPRELESILKEDRPSAPKVVPSDMLLESGEQTLITTSPRVEQVSLLINRDDRVSGRDYKDASGYLRLVPRHHGAHAVSVQLVPVIHHGPLQRTFPMMPTAAGLAPQELTIRDAQQEEAIRELSIDMLLEEGQVAIIGCRPDNLRSLGTFLFSQSSVENDVRHQRLVLIWASRNMPGVVAETPKSGDRPKLFRRRMTVPDEPAPTPDAPDPAPPSIAGPPPPTPTSARGAGTRPGSPANTPMPTPTPPAAGAPQSAAPPPEAQYVPPVPPRGSGQ